MLNKYAFYTNLLHKNNIQIGPLTFKPVMFYISAALLILLLFLLLYLYRLRHNQQKSGNILSSSADSVPKTEDLLSEDTAPDKYARYQVGKLHNIGKREGQQDSFAVSDVCDYDLCNKKGVIAIVADGMGGLSDGDKVSSMVTFSFFKFFHEAEFNNPSEALLTMLANANEEVNNYLGNKITQSGSTLVAGIIKECKLYWISVGDSHIYHYRNGNLIQLNREHTYSHELDAKAANGEISREAALKDPQRNALTSYIGMGRLEKIDRNTTPLNLSKGDRILFMSDGVFGTVGDETIEKIMVYPVDDSIHLLDEYIKSTGKSNQDNYTAVIIQCN